VSIRLTTPLAQQAPGPKPAQDLQRHTARAAASHLSPAEITKRDAASVDEDATALDRTLAAGKRLDPPGRKPRRDWRLHVCNRAENCSECGRIIEPNTDRYVDLVSGHLVRHVECHRKAGSR